MAFPCNTVNFGFQTWTADINRPYLQSSEPLCKSIFINEPKPEFELRHKQCSKLLRSLYSLSDSDELWHVTMDRYHRKVVGMTPFRVDPAYLSRLSGSYDDDLIRYGSSLCCDLHLKTKENFETKEESSVSYYFTGCRINCLQDGIIVIYQKGYLRKLENIPLNASFRQFGSMTMRPAWLAQSRHDCLFELYHLS